MPHNFVADSFHTETLQQTFWQRSAILDGKRPFCILSPLWGLGSTNNVHLGLTGKHVEDFLLMLIELLSLGVMAEML